MSFTEENTSSIETPKQLIMVLLAAFVFPITIILLLAHAASGSIPADKNNPALSGEAIAKRLKPVGSLVLTSTLLQAGERQKKEAGQASTMVSLVAVSGDTDRIKVVYTASCAACHASGAAGAPKLGDKQAWAPRIKSGNDTLYNSAIKGKKAMPAKGGNVSLSDVDVMAVVDYMVSQAK
ncbi:MAG: c-type cytochrome [Nitrosomonadaceae bacterium]